MAEYAALGISNSRLGKLNMGKSCIRFRYSGVVPYDLLAQLWEKVTVEEYISAYEAIRKPR